MIDGLYTVEKSYRRMIGEDRKSANDSNSGLTREEMITLVQGFIDQMFKDENGSRFSIKVMGAE